MEASDPENRLYWRFAPRRLDWESLRDALLVAAGQLEPRTGGPPIDQSPDALESKCRTIYLTVDRQHISTFARDFDFPAPDMTVPQRSQTIVPPQQLFFLNSPFVIEQARAAASLAIEASASDSENIVALFRQILGRDPLASELAAANDYVHNIKNPAGGDSRGRAEQDEKNGVVGSADPITVPTVGPNAWGRLAQALLQSSEFIYVP
jgi:hypothetical protein